MFFLDIWVAYNENEYVIASQSAVSSIVGTKRKYQPPGEGTGLGFVENFKE